MNKISSTAVRSFIMHRYGPRLAQKHSEAHVMPDDYDLLQEGIIDSLGILELVSSVEEHFRIQLDLENLEAEDLTKIGPFCRFVEHFSQSGTTP